MAAQSPSLPCRSRGSRRCRVAPARPPSVSSGARCTEIVPCAEPGRLRRGGVPERGRAGSAAAAKGKEKKGRGLGEGARLRSGGSAASRALAEPAWLRNAAQANARPGKAGAPVRLGRFRDPSHSDGVPLLVGVPCQIDQLRNRQRRKEAAIRRSNRNLRRKSAASSFVDPRQTAFPRISGGVNSAAGPRTCGTLYHARSQLGSAIGMTIAPSAWARRAAFPGAPKPLWYSGRRGRFAAWAAPPHRRSGHGRKHHRRNVQHLASGNRNHRPFAGEEGMTANRDFRHKRSRDTLESSPALTM